MTLRRVAGALAATVLTTAGLVASPALPAAPAASLGPAGVRGAAQQGWESAVQELLDRRAAALVSRDREAFLATVDPRASDGFRDAQARLFDGAASVPLESYELTLRTEDAFDLSQGVPSGHGADEVRLPAVEERHRIRGVDAVDAVADLWLTFVRRGDRWFVNDDDDVADLGLLTQRWPWDYGPVTLVESDQVVVMADPADADRARSLLDITLEAFARLRRSLDWPAPPKVLVVLPRSTDELEKILQTNFDLSNFVAFATADVDRADEVGGWMWTSPRVFAQEANLARHGRDFQIETLHHELVHVVAFDKAGPNISNWIHEGHADWLALDRPRPRAVTGTDGRLPLDHEFVTGDGTSILRAYRESESAVAFLGARVGPDAPSRLFEELGAIRLTPGTWRYHLDAVLTSVYGAGFEPFQADWNGGR